MPNEPEKKILIVDDEPGLLLTLGNRLKVNHFQVITADIGPEGIAKAKSEKPDLILLDVLMPEMNGYQVLEELKRDERTRHIPVIMMTVKFRKEDIEQAVSLGAADYLIKPFEAEIFIQKVRNALGLS